MPHHLRELTEARELELLSPYAAKAAQSRGRQRPEDEDPVRTCYQRDRDRILHSKSFRRLKHKTQVFIDPQGDHYRTRLTHTLEVAQIARTVGRALRLNEDLIEAIALGHDVGHTPFGHMGERALDEVLKERHTPVSDGTAFGKCEQSAPAEEPGFRHYEQSLRVVDHLENLNLTHETRMGIGGHSKGRNDLSEADGRIPEDGTLESAVVRISDRIAYLNHDLDDAIRSGLVKDVPAEFLRIGDRHGRRVGAMVEDVIVNSLDQPAIRLSSAMLSTLNDLKEWLFENVYLLYPVRYPESEKVRVLMRELFLHYLQPGHLPEGFSGVQGAVDYVAGMTDRFALDTYVRLKVPRGFVPDDAIG